MNVAQLTAAFLLATCAFAPLQASECSAANPDANEAAMPGGWSISVYRSDGTPASKVPAKSVAAAVAAASTTSGHEVAEGGLAVDGNQLGRSQLLYLRVNFPDDTREWITQDDAYRDCRSVADYYAENSYGALQLSFDVTPLVTMPRSFLYYRELPIPTWVGNGGVPAFLADARVVARQAGYDPDHYRFIIIGHRTIFAANTGGTDVQVQEKGWQVLAHEVGHSLGALHSVFWQTDGTSAHGARSWRAFTAALVNNLYSTQVVPYGDPWCMMGGKLGHFSIYWKLALGWLPVAQVPEITSSGRYRVTALDYPTLDRNRLYGFSIRRNHQQVYYAGYRLRQVDGRAVQFPIATETWLPNSLLLWGGPWDGSLEPNTPPLPVPYLIDTTPGSPSSLTAAIGDDLPTNGGNIGGTPWVKDAGIQVGRTFSDPAAGIHITVVDRVRTEPEALDVVVNLGSFASNRKPTVTLTATGGTQSDTGQYMVAHTAGQPTAAIGFRAVASDPDGDELAYWWDFGDVSGVTVNSDRTTHAWSDATVGSGRLLTVRVVVSDMKGGVASAILPINIGLSEFPPATLGAATGRNVLWASGRVVDQAGEPVEGVRITWTGSPWKGTYTDSDGRYWLGQIGNSAWTFEVGSEQYAAIGVNEAAPSSIIFAQRDLKRLDYVLYKRQTISVESAVATAAPSDTVGFTVRRSYASPLSGTVPAAYTIPDLPALTGFSQLRVRLYAYTGAGVTWEWLDPADSTWKAFSSATRNFYNIELRTPENTAQRRFESGVPNQNPASSPAGDLYLTFPPGAASMQLRCHVGSDDPAWRRDVSLMVAHSPDYYVENDEARVWVMGTGAVHEPVVSVRCSASEVFEGSGESVLVEAVSDVPTTTRLVIPLSKSGAAVNRLSALSATDPNAIDLVIEPGQTTASVRVFPINDTLTQGTESATFTIADAGAGNGYVLGTATDSVQVADNDRQRVWITNTVGPAREDTLATARFTVHRSGNLANALVVGLNLGGSAVPNTDYAMATTATIPAGLTSVDVVLTPVADNLLERDETVVVTVVQTNDVRVVNPGSATCIIQDRALPTVTVTSALSKDIFEEGATTGTFTLHRDLTVEALKIPFSLSGTANYAAGDYSFDPPLAEPDYFTFPVGVADITVGIKAYDDFFRELADPDSEYVHVQLLRGATHNLVQGSDQFRAVIFDDEADVPTQKISVEMEQAALTVDEPRNVAPGTVVSFETSIVWSGWPEQPSPWDSADLSQVAKVDYEIIEDSALTDGDAKKAKAGVNFIAAGPTTVQIVNANPARSRTRRVTVAVGIRADALYSTQDKRFLIRLSNPQHCEFRTLNNGTEDLATCVVTIKDVNSGFIAVTAPNPAVTAGATTTGAIRIARTMTGGNFALPVNVDLELFGNAVPRVDFTQIGTDADAAGWDGDTTMLRRFTIPGNAAFLDVDVAGLGALIERDPRDLNVRVARAPGYDYDVADEATVIISSPASDTRPMVSIAVADSVGYESSANTVAFTLTRSSTAGALTVPVVLSSLSNAVAADFTSVPASVTFAAGAATASFTLTPVNDGLTEGTETAIMALVSNSSTAFRVGGNGSATAWIVDASTPLPLVWLEPVNPTVQEEDAEPAGNGARAKVRLFRSGEQAYPLSVTVNRGGTATAPADYADPGPITIPAGQVSVDIEVDPAQDATQEGDETVVLTLVDGTAYNLKPDASTETMTIIDDDAASVSIEPLADGVEGGADMTFTVTRSCSDISGSLTVTVSLAGGATNPAVATDVVDFDPVTVVIPATAVSATLSIPIDNDTEVEPDESVLATVVAGSGYVPAPGAGASAEGIIRDNDAQRVSLTLLGASRIAEKPETTPPAPVAVLETTTVRISRTGADLSDDLVVHLALSGTATPGADFSAIAGGEYVLAVGVATIPATQTYVDVTVTALDDTLVEDTESVVMTVVADATYLLDDAALSAAIDVVDNDSVRIGVVGPANFKPGSTFGGPLVYRFYRIGSTEGPLQVNFTLGGDLTEGVEYPAVVHALNLDDGEDHADVTISLRSGYDDSARKNLVCTVAPPALAGSYAPGGVPGISGGLLSATTQILSDVDTLLVKAQATVPTTVEGNLTGATIAFQANTSLGAARTATVTRIPGVSTAWTDDYEFAPVMPAAIPNGTTLVSVKLKAKADYLESEPREYVLLALDQPAGDEYFSVGLPVLFRIDNTVPPQPDVTLRFNSAGGTEIGGTDAMAGTQKVGSPFIRRYYVVNEGSLPLTVSDIAIDTATAPSGCTASIDFMSETLPHTLATSESIRVDVLITPNIFGVWNCGLVVTSDDPDQPTMTTRIYGVGDKTTTDGTASASANEGTGEGGPCGVGGMAGLLVGAGLLLAGVRRASRRKAA